MIELFVAYIMHLIIFSHKCEFCDLLAVESLQTWLYFFFGTQEKLLWRTLVSKQHSTRLSFIIYMDREKNLDIFFCVAKTNELHSGLERHGD